jgi:MFS family permease
MTYLSEFRVNWRYLTAAAIGLGSGYSLNQYFNSIFAPHLLHEFGWSKSQFALLGGTILISMVGVPIFGRLTDIFGVRRIAAIGVIGAPAVFVAYSQMGGNFTWFFLINILQHILVGNTTTSTVYGRLIAQKFDRSRGSALALAACAPAAVAALSGPFLSSFIDAHGWRAGYLVLAVGCGIVGAIALLFIPPHQAAARKGALAPVRSARRDYPEILRNPVFQIIAVGMLLCNFTLSVHGSQLKLIILESGMASATASLMISFFATGVVIGRLTCGFALDRFPSHIVATVGLGLPGIGLLILASGINDPMLIGSAVLLLGLSMGSELDITGYLVMRYFKVDVYSTVHGLVVGVVAFSAALGSFLLSYILKLGGSFSYFLVFSAVATMCGSTLFMLLARRPMLVGSARALSTQ